MRTVAWVRTRLQVREGCGGACTVQRWEHSKGLPVHRVGEGKRVPIYALKYELDDWWRSSEPLDAGTPPEAHRRLWLRGLAVGGLLAVGTFTLWWLSARKPAPEPRVLPLTSESGMVHSPTFSPDSSQLAFGWKSGNQDKFQLYVRMASGDRKSTRLNSSHLGI